MGMIPLGSHCWLKWRVTHDTYACTCGQSKYTITPSLEKVQDWSEGSNSKGITNIKFLFQLFLGKAESHISQVNLQLPIKPRIMLIIQSLLELLILLLSLPLKYWDYSHALPWLFHVMWQLQACWASTYQMTYSHKPTMPAFKGYFYYIFHCKY